jgi:hypothetical protein
VENSIDEACPLLPLLLLIFFIQKKIKKKETHPIKKNKWLKIL